MITTNFQEEIGRRFKFQTEYLESSNSRTKKACPIVSVIVTTYQHMAHIKQCLDGILVQQTHFTFEVIIGEDQSTDGTREICIAYAKEHPDKIRLYLRDRNLSHLPLNSETSAILNQIFSIMSAKGRYIAFCDGDDYWTDSLKLQKQIDFLEDRHDYGLVHTGYAIKYELSGAYSNPVHVVDQGNIFENLLIGENQLATLTVVARKNLLLEYIGSMELIHLNWRMGDYPMWLYISMRTKIGYIPDVTSTYRVLSESASHSNNKEKTLAFLRSISQIKQYFYPRYPDNNNYVFRWTYRKMYSLYQFNLFRRFGWSAFSDVMAIIKNDPLALVCSLISVIHRKFIGLLYPKSDDP